MNGGDSQVVGISCSIWAAELAALRQQGKLTFPIRFVSSLLHIYPQRLGGRLDELVEEELRRGNSVLILFGDCHAHMCDYSARPCVARIAGINCIEALLGKEEYRRHLREGVFFLIPEWARRWHEVIPEALGLDAAGTKTLMREMHTRLVYLDTRLVPVPLTHLQEASEFTGLPFEIRVTGLDCFLENILQARRMLLPHDA